MEFGEVTATNIILDADSRDVFLCQMQHRGGMDGPMTAQGFILSGYKLVVKVTGLRPQLFFDAAICWSRPSSLLQLPRFMPPPLFASRPSTDVWVIPRYFFTRRRGSVWGGTILCNLAIVPVTTLEAPSPELGWRASLDVEFGIQPVPGVAGLIPTFGMRGGQPLEEERPWSNHARELAGFDLDILHALNFDVDNVSRW